MWVPDSSKMLITVPERIAVTVVLRREYPTLMVALQAVMVPVELTTRWRASAAGVAADGEDVVGGSGATATGPPASTSAGVCIRSP